MGLTVQQKNKDEFQLKGIQTPQVESQQAQWEPGGLAWPAPGDHKPLHLNNNLTQTPFDGLHGGRRAGHRRRRRPDGRGRLARPGLWSPFWALTSSHHRGQDGSATPRAWAALLQQGFPRAAEPHGGVPPPSSSEQGLSAAAERRDRRAHPARRGECFGLRPGAGGVERSVSIAHRRATRPRRHHSSRLSEKPLFAPRGANRGFCLQPLTSGGGEAWLPCGERSRRLATPPAPGLSPKHSPLRAG